MGRSFADSLIGPAENTSAAINRSGFVDIHCHCLAGIDDGPATKAEAFALCRDLVADSISTVIATPHQLGRFTGCNEATQIREQVFVFNEELKNSRIALTVLPGADVRVDERICELLEADKILTLADGGKYILLELPHEVFIDITPLLIELASMGIQVIISHPERHPALVQRPEILNKWLEQSAHFQVTSASLLGQFGPAARRAAWNFFTSGWVSVVATDSHDLQTRRPCMKVGYECISAELGENVAHLVCVENPSRVIKGHDIIPVSTAESSLSMSTKDGSDERLQSCS